MFGQRLPSISQLSNAPSPPAIPSSAAARPSLFLNARPSAWVASHCKYSATSFSCLPESPALLRDSQQVPPVPPPINRPPQPPPQPPPPATKPSTSTRKRKAIREPSPEQPEESTDTPPPRARAKRSKLETNDSQQQQPPIASTRRRKGKAITAMSSAGPSAGPSDETSTPQPVNSSSSSGKRKSNRKKDSQDPSPTGASSSRRSRKASPKADDDVTMKDAPDAPTEGHRNTEDAGNMDQDNDRPYDEEEEDDDDEGEDDDPFGAAYFSRHGASSHLSNTLRALSGIVSGMHARLRQILENMRSDDQSSQLVGLQELSEILLVSTEDNLAGHFAPDIYAKELVRLMQPGELEENPEIMLLACRCIANLMEALPASTSNVVYSGAVPVLCQKLLEIHYIDLAEQALSTLEKISAEFPASIVREGGLTACLTYLDFFATSTQRVAVTTAANCCRNIPEDAFPTIRDVMPILLNVLNSNDQKVVEQGCLCVSRVVESFRFHESKLEELVSPDLLRAVLRLLLPGTTNLIGANIHTLFLRVLAITARASPRLSVELFKMNVVDTLYQILTGVSPPSDMDDVSTKIDSVVIMQALIHRPREQIFETLNVICELLPNVARDDLLYLDNLFDAGYPGDEVVSLSRTKKPIQDKRLESLNQCKNEVKRFAIILLPTLTDAYSSTVNLSVRQKVLTAQLKMLSNLDIEILEEALRIVPYASYIASILSQEDHHTLVTFALQAAELLLKRLEPIYRYQFYREGVMAEISRLASRPSKGVEAPAKGNKAAVEVEPVASSRGASPMDDVEVGREADENGDAETHSDVDDDDEDDEADDDDEEDDDANEHNQSRDDGSDSGSSSSSEHGYAPTGRSQDKADDVVTLRAKKFVDVHETKAHNDAREKAAAILSNLKQLARDIEAYRSGAESTEHDPQLFTSLAQYFEGDALQSITSYELLESGIVNVLLKIFSPSENDISKEARCGFLEAFMASSSKRSDGDSASTPFSVLVKKLQDLLSRAEHFDVITVHQNSYDSNRNSAASMLAKQLRLRLVADEDSGIPRTYRNIMVSIHAIATFKALDDYLRPRISLAEKPRAIRDRHVEYIAAQYAAALTGGAPPDLGRRSSPGFPSATPTDSTNRTTRTPKTSKSSPPPQPESSSAASRQPASRRSGRKYQQGAPPPPPPPPPPPIPHAETNESNEPLECADEQRLTDEDDITGDGALDAIMGELGEEIEEEAPDPSAVSVEVASTGKVTARNDDGTRVHTPLQNSTPSRTSTSARHAAQRFAELTRGTQHQSSGTSTSSSRPMSYAAAIQAIPQDWHIEFSVNDQSISNETTIYRAVHFNPTLPNDISVRTIWNAIHTIKFKRVPGPPPPENSSLSPPPESSLSASGSGMPLSLDNHPATSSILQLLSILHGLNANMEDVLIDNKDQVRLASEPLSQFVNTKLTAKLNRQLEEPLIVASNCLPSWSEDLARLYPFLFPFETRHLFLQSTSFGYSRSMARWQNAQSASDSRHDRHRDERPFLGRLQRQKVRISRSKILESALKVMELYGSSPSMLEVEYFEEVGTGLGPTLEFYSTVSKEFSKKKLQLWRENDSSGGHEYAFGKQGLYPAPLSDEQALGDNGKRVLHLFKMLGKFVARSMLDSRIIDISFNPTFFRVRDDSAAVPPSLGALKTVDADLAKSLKLLKKFANAKKEIDEDGSMTAAQKVQGIQNIQVDQAHIDDLGLDFTLPGYASIELIPNGSEIPVTIDNVSDYIDKVLEFTLGSGVQRQINAFRSGFSQVFPYSALKAFTPDELVMLFGRVDEDWTLETLMDSIKADHGYNLDSKSVRNLLQAMSEFTMTERRDFLQFVTGSPKLPIGGFKSLTPMFTVVCKPSEPPLTSDDYLPSVMTCVNYLKMPDYTNMGILKNKLNVAIKEGQGAFHLS